LKKERKESEELLLQKLDNINKSIETKEDINLLYDRAKIYIQLGKNAYAINDYNRIIKIDNNQQYAKSQVEFLKTILKYNNTDIYASPNTNFDPWLDE